MRLVQISARIDPTVRKAVAAYCRQRGLKIARFVEDALLDKLDELQDAGQLDALRRDARRPFDAFVADLKARGKL